MPSESYAVNGGESHGYVKLPSEPPPQRSNSVRKIEKDEWIFDELPKASVVSVSRPDASEFSPILLTYTIEIQYKQTVSKKFTDKIANYVHQFKWQLVKRPSQVFSLHFALKKRAIIEEFYEKQGQVKEWLHNLGIGEHTAVMDDEDEHAEVFVSSSHEDHPSSRRNVPSRAAFPVIRTALATQQSISERAKVAMQGYLSHFMGNLDIANSREVCKFLEVSKLSLLPQYGLKLKEGYVMVKHLPKIHKDIDDGGCCSCLCLRYFSSNWQKVWAVLKPGFVALLEDPLKTKLLDIIFFDVLPSVKGKEESQAYIAKEIKERNPLRHGFEVSSGRRTVTIRVNDSSKVKCWVSAINDVGLRPQEGWCYPHTFGSFAPSRGLTDDGSLIQWFIDGDAAFSAIASSIEDAKSEIFITGWWLCPELYLRRPFHDHPLSRLDALLEAKAKQGVQIYILLYKEVALALKINSEYSKRKLLKIHENVKVLRYPDHFSTGVYLWSHHEKIVVVDYQICYLGGLDLCFGRYDTPEHRISDSPSTIWPGKDYYNPRESEPNSWEDTMKDELDRGKYPRMPWHDVHCALWGPPCRDVARHFIQRWNYSKRNKAPYEQAIPLLMPQHHMVLPHYMNENQEVKSEDEKQEDNQNEKHMKDSSPISSSFEDVPLLLPQESEGEDACINEPSYYELDTAPGAIDIPNRIGQSPPISFQNVILQNASPVLTNGFIDNIISPYPERRTTQAASQDFNEWWEKQERGNLVSSSTDVVGQVGPRTPCQCQIVRSVDQWSAGSWGTEESIHNAYISLIEKAEHFIYIENQFFISGLSGDDVIKNRVAEALYKRIARAHRERKCFRVIVVIPLLPGFQGGLSDGGAATVRALVHWQVRTISVGPRSILRNLYDVMGSTVDDYISFYGLRTYGRLEEEGLVATNQVYVHSKLMIIDDRLALVGSANINDRSLLGSRDSEIAVVVEDKEFVASQMNGEPWKAGKFSFSLRLSLWSEHLGLHAREVEQVFDPVKDATYKDIWMETAKANTRIYDDVFSCIPNDSIHSRAAIRQTMSYWKERLKYTTIDLGIAPDKLELCQNGEAETTDPMERLQSVKGHLVSFPLDFMSEEDLRPGLYETEFYATPQVFH